MSEYEGPAISNEPDKEDDLLDLTTPEMTAKLAEAPIYRKNAIVEAQQVTEQTTVTTKLADGTEETVNTAEAGDYIVTNPSGEKYVLKPDNFAKRYEPMEDGKFRAKGMSRAFVNPTGGPISIMAPWGEVQKGGPDCMIATVYDPEHPDEIGSDRYIIGGDEFKQTFELAPDQN